jgi:O-antigen ligase
MELLSKDHIEERKKYNPLIWGTIGYLFMFIFRPFEYWEWLGDYHIEKIYMIGFTFLITFWDGKKYRHHPLTSALLSFFGVMCFSYLIAYRQDVAGDQIWEYFKLLVFYAAMLLTVESKRDFKIVLISFIVIMGLYVSKSLWEFLFNNRHVYVMGIRRMVGIDKTFNDPNSFGATVIYSLPFVLALWKAIQSKLMKIGLLSYSVISMAAIVFTGSRSAYVTLIFLMILVWIQGKMKVLGALGVAFTLIAGFMVMPEAYMKRFETIYKKDANKSATESAQGRLEGLKNGIELFKMQPFLGWGTGNFPYAVEEIGQHNRMQPHNLYGQLLSELGILGCLSFLGICLMLIKTWRRIIKNCKGHPFQTTLFEQTGTACFNTLILLLFQGNFGHNLYRYTWIYICAFIILADEFTIESVAGKA